MDEVRIGPVRTPSLMLFLAASSTAAAQDVSGEYLLLHQGSEVMSVKIRSAGSGRISGEASAASNSMPFTGTISGRTVSFTTTSPDGTRVRWNGPIYGTTFNATLSDPSGSQTYAFTKRGAGWTSGSALARQWTQRLTGTVFSRTERTGGGSSGSATKDMSIAFCDAGRALYEERFALSVSVPGMGGGGTSRDAEGARWRAITNGSTAAIEVRTKAGDTFQLGIRAGDGVTYIAEQPVRLTSAGGKCSHPALLNVPPEVIR